MDMERQTYRGRRDVEINPLYTEKRFILSEKRKKEKNVQTELKSELNTDLNTELIWNEPLITGTTPDCSGSRQNQRGRDRLQSIGKRFQRILEILQRTRQKLFLLVSVLVLVVEAAQVSSVAVMKGLLLATSVTSTVMKMTMTTSGTVISVFPR